MVYASEPVDRTARLVTDNTGCDSSVMLDWGGLKRLLVEVSRKRVIIGRKLGITSATQARNLVYRLKKRRGGSYGMRNRSLKLEYCRLGEEINMIVGRIAEVKKEYARGRGK